MPKQINSASVGQRLVQLFSLKGRFQPVLDEVIVPVVSVDPESVEQLPAAAMGGEAAVAAEYGYGSLRNPVGSGLLIHVTRLITLTASNVRINGTVGWLAGANAMTADWRDARLPGSPAATTVTDTSAVSIAGSAIETWVSSGAGDTYLNTSVDYWLGEGDGFLVMLNDPNIALYNITFEWTEQAITSLGYR